MRYFLKTAFLISLSTVLIGCSNSTNNGSFVGAGVQQKNIAAIADDLSKRDVMVTQKADVMILTLRNQHFFIGKSANFTGQALETLELIFDLSKYQKGNTMAIIGYTPKCKTGQVDKALAKARAHRIMQYLWNSGLYANFVYSAGNDRPVESSKTSLTDCVVIKFRDFY